MIKSNIIQLISQIKEHRKQKLGNTKELLNSLFPVKEKINNVRNYFNLNLDNSFNIFTAFSDTYYKENLHNQILACILDPSTKDIGNYKYFLHFHDLLSKMSKKGQIETFQNEIFVIPEREERIDILIHDNKYAIIIENKIHGAIDQPNQLARYYEHVENELKLTTVAIVYLILIPGKKPTINFDDNYKNYTRKINDKLIILPVVDKSGNHNLCCSFLEKCYESTNKENCLASVFLKQYTKLLNHLGGELLTMDYKKELLREICASEENISTVKELVDTWRKRDRLFPPMLLDSILKQTRDMGYEHAVISNNEQRVAKRTPKGICVTFGFDKEGCYYGFFANDEKEKIEKKDLVRQILEDKMIHCDKISALIEEEENCSYRRLFNDIPREEIINRIDIYTDQLVAKLGRMVFLATQEGL